MLVVIYLIIEVILLPGIPSCFVVIYLIIEVSLLSGIPSCWLLFISLLKPACYLVFHHVGCYLSHCISQLVIWYSIMLAVIYLIIEVSLLSGIPSCWLLFISL